MNGMHGIIFSYEKENGLRELIETASTAPSPSAVTTASSTSSSPAW